MKLLRKEAEEILNNWEIGRLRKIKNLEKGQGNYNWMIKTNIGTSKSSNTSFIDKS